MLEVKVTIASSNDDPPVEEIVDIFTSSRDVNLSYSKIPGGSMMKSDLDDVLFYSEDAPLH